MDIKTGQFSALIITSLQMNLAAGSCDFGSYFGSLNISWN